MMQHIPAFLFSNVAARSAAAADVTAPTLSSASATETGATTADLSVSTDEGNGTLYWVVTTSSTAPSAAQVKAGQDNSGSAAADSGSETVNATGTQNASATGLTASTAYTAHFMHEDAATNQSSVASSSEFTTDAAAGYTANAVSFDGTNDYLEESSVSGLVDGKQGLFSAWINIQGTSGVSRYLLGMASDKLSIYRPSTNVLRFLGRNAAGTIIIDMGTAASHTAAGWKHFLGSFDLATGVGHIYIDDVSDREASPTLTDDNIDYTVFNWAVGARGGGTSLWEGDVGDFFFDPSYLDITVEANRRKFIDASGKPVDLGADGSTPLGTQPLLFFANPTATWHTNLGSGGGFTENGALTDAPSSPSD